MLSLAKIPLIFTTALFYDRSFTAPPSPPVAEEEQKKALKAPDISLTERLIPPAGFLLKVGRVLRIYTFLFKRTYSILCI